MKLTARISGLAASGTLAGLIYLGYFSMMRPIEVLTLAVCGAGIMGAMGFIIGQILDHPSNPRKGGKAKGSVALASHPSTTALSTSEGAIEAKADDELGISIELPETYNTGPFISEDTDSQPTQNPV